MDCVRSAFSITISVKSGSPNSGCFFENAHFFSSNKDMLGEVIGETDRLRSL